MCCRPLTREELAEKRRRQALVEQYAYQQIVTDSNGDIVGCVDVDEGEDDGSSGLVNTNAARVAAALQHQKLQAQQSHHAKGARDKDALQKQREKKEKAKKGSQKKEKRRM